MAKISILVILYFCGFETFSAFWVEDRGALLKANVYDFIKEQVAEGGQ